MRRLASDHQPASVGGWREIVGNPNLAEAILHGIIHNVAGASMRKRRIFEPSAWPSNQRKTSFAATGRRASQGGRHRTPAGFVWGQVAGFTWMQGGFVGIRSPSLAAS
jgi:hypothetical protein